MKPKKFLVLLASLVLALSCGACRAMDNNPKTPDIPSVTTPKKDKTLDDPVIPRDKDGTPDVLPDVSPDLTPDVRTDDTPDVTPDATPDATPDLTPNDGSDTAPDPASAN